MREMRAVEFVQRLIDNGQLSAEKYMRVFVHRVDGADPLKAFSAASKFDSSWDSLIALRNIGRAAAQKWLSENYEHIGVRDTIDLRAEYF